jgi:membrane-bound lytic murein transglycosylase A
LSVPLTAGRSAALDPACYPKGIVGFLETEQPVLDDSGEVKEWAPLRRWVVNQDTGGAIKGPERLDLFFGSGEEAGRRAGRMKQPGKLVILLKK